MSEAAAALGAVVEIRDFLRSTQGSVFMGRYAQDFYDVRGTHLEEDLGAKIAGALSVAEVFHVQPDMTPLVRWAAQGLPAQSSFAMQTLPAESGFVLLGQAIPLVDARGKTSALGAISWQRRADANGSGRAGVHMCWWADASDPADQLHETWKEHGARRPGIRLSLFHTAHLPFGEKVGEAALSVPPEELQRWEATGAPPTAEPSENALRLPLALFELFGQHIVVSARAPMSPGARRGWERKRVQPDVVVVHLRAPVRREGEEVSEQGRRRYLSRWIVRGHWRNQAHGPGHAHRRLIWISPHLAGPEDAPLVSRTKVYDLAR